MIIVKFDSQGILDELHKLSESYKIKQLSSTTTWYTEGNFKSQSSLRHHSHSLFGWINENVSEFDWYIFNNKMSKM